MLLCETQNLPVQNDTNTPSLANGTNTNFTFQYKIAQTPLYHPTQTRLNGCRVLSVDKCWSVFMSNCWEAWWGEQESWLSYTWDLHKHQSNCWQLLFYANLMFRRELRVARFNCRVCIAYYANLAQSESCLSWNLHKQPAGVGVEGILFKTTTSLLLTDYIIFPPHVHQQL